MTGTKLFANFGGKWVIPPYRIQGILKSELIVAQTTPNTTKFDRNLNTYLSCHNFSPFLLCKYFDISLFVIVCAIR